MRRDLATWAARRALARPTLTVLALGVAACATSGPAQRPEASRIQYGDATFYGRYHHGKPTASGEPFDMYALTAAHLHLRLGTRVRVTNLRNGKQVVVRINDRGPYGNRRRIIDLSYAAARAIDMIIAGVVPVRLEVLAP
jgi:rare lipoprotein A